AARGRPVRRRRSLRGRPGPHHLAARRRRMNSFDHWALSLAVFVPMAGVVAMMLIPRAQETALKATALLTTVATAGMGVYLLFAFDYGKSRVLQFEVDKSWIETINSRYHIGIDGISLPLLALSMLITVLLLVYSCEHAPQ